MDAKEVCRRWDEERRALVNAGEVVEVLPDVTRVRAADGSWHLIRYSSLTDATADRAIDEQVAHFRALGAADVEWKAYGHDRPDDLVERLRGRGFEIGPPEAVLALDLADRPAWVDEPSRYEVVRVGDAAHLALFRAAAEEIFGKNYDRTVGELARAIEAGSTQHVGYAALDGGVAVSIGRLYAHPDSRFGGLYGGGTRATHRGRGCYRAVVAARARDAAALGARYLLVDALPTSRPILERLGFVHVSDTWPCTWRA